MRWGVVCVVTVLIGMVFDWRIFFPLLLMFWVMYGADWWRAHVERHSQNRDP